MNSHIESFTPTPRHDPRYGDQCCGGRGVNGCGATPALRLKKWPSVMACEDHRSALMSHLYRIDKAISDDRAIRRTRDMHDKQFGRRKPK